MLKALAREPESRYSSVEQLAGDIRRYLGGLPVLAREPTFVYRAGKFVRRYRLRLAVAAVLVGLACGLILAQAREIAQVRRISTSLVDLVKALQPATPDQKVEIEAALEEAARIVNDRMFANHPLDQALLMEALGWTYTSLGRYDEARPLLENVLEIRRRVLGKDHLLVAESLSNLALLDQLMGDLARAEARLRESLQIHSQSSEPDAGELSKAISNLAIVLHDQGRYGEAEAFLRRVLDMRGLLGDDHPDVVRARSNLASALVKQGAYAEAEPLYRRNLEVRLRQHGPDHADVAASRNQLATALYYQGKLDAAEAEAREALRIRRAVYGPRHQKVAGVLNNLGTICQAGGALDGAETAYREALAIFREKLGDDHKNVALTRKNLAAVLSARGDPEAAAVLAKQALTTLREAMAPGSWRIADAESVYGGSLAGQGHFTQAEELLVPSFEIILEALGGRAPYSQDAARRLVGLYEAWGKPEKAEAVRRLVELPGQGREDQ